jgi:TonB family protein
MKYYFLILLTLPLCTNIVYSQKTNKSNIDNTVYLGHEINKSPNFKGGDKLLKKYIFKHFKFKKDFIFTSKTLFTISFTIEKNGIRTNYTSFQNTRNKEQSWMIDSALSMIKKMPLFTPAIKNGKKVRCLYCIEFANCNYKEIQFSNHIVYKCDATLDDICIDFNPCDVMQDVENEVLHYSEQMPEFIGGIDSLNNFIEKNLIYPKDAKENEVAGKVILRFIVEKDGTISQPQILGNHLGWGCDEEAIRLLKSFPKWKPGTQNGKTVRVEFTLPIKFKMQ